jgi:hypothetical protein
MEPDQPGRREAARGHSLGMSEYAERFRTIAEPNSAVIAATYLAVRLFTKGKSRLFEAARQAQDE